MTEDDAVYVKYEFVGYVSKFNENRFGKELTIRTNPDETGLKYPQRVMFSTSEKKKDLVPDVSAGDKVRIEFMPILIEGVSKGTNKVYAINKLFIQSCEILEKGAVQESESTSGDADDLPF